MKHQTIQLVSEFESVFELRVILYLTDRELESVIHGMTRANDIAKILAEAEQEGFLKGWQAARDALSAPMPNVKVAGRATPAPVKKKQKAKSAIKETPLFAVPTVEKRVRSCIEANPGKTGAEIIKLLGEVNPRTVRTMLRRLKTRGKIQKSGEGWFTVLE